MFTSTHITPDKVRTSPLAFPMSQTEDRLRKKVHAALKVIVKIPTSAI